MTTKKVKIILIKWKNCLKNLEITCILGTHRYFKKTPKLKFNSIKIKYYNTTANRIIKISKQTNSNRKTRQKSLKNRRSKN